MCKDITCSIKVDRRAGCLKSEHLDAVPLGNAAANMDDLHENGSRWVGCIWENPKHEVPGHCYLGLIAKLNGTLNCEKKKILSCLYFSLRYQLLQMSMQGREERSLSARKSEGGRRLWKRNI